MRLVGTHSQSEITVSSTGEAIRNPAGEIVVVFQARGDERAECREHKFLDHHTRRRTR
ncbi:hypothetical protein B0H12DRAFT_1106364 [Mycena haematopus]|nr:hypothetical protein B0H12DRAFT_1106364 [Mycena haematopus]